MLPTFLQQFLRVVEVGVADGGAPGRLGVELDDEHGLGVAGTVVFEGKKSPDPAFFLSLLHPSHLPLPHPILGGTTIDEDTFP